MVPLRDIKGLKFPDPYVVRHFFKCGLADRVGRVLELGCATGNNLRLYREWDWACVGIDRDPAALAAAGHNLGEGATLVRADLGEDFPPFAGSFDAVIIPGLLCYLTLAQARSVLLGLKPLLAADCAIFVRTRLVDDYRYGRGVEEEPDGFRLATPETGEAGLFNHFYTQASLIGLLTETLGLVDRVELAVRFDNVQAGRRVPGNSDLVVWGIVP